MYGNGVVTEQTCQNWLKKFCARDFSLDDTPWSGRPVEVDSDQIETLRTLNTIPYRREPTYSKCPNQQLLVIMQNVSFNLHKKPYGLFSQPNTLVSILVVEPRLKIIATSTEKKERGEGRRRKKQRAPFVRSVFLARFGDSNIAHLTLPFVKKRLLCPFYLFIYPHLRIFYY